MNKLHTLYNMHHDCPKIQLLQCLAGCLAGSLVHERISVWARGGCRSFHIALTVNVVIQIYIAEFHVDEVEIKRVAAPAMTEYLDNILMASVTRQHIKCLHLGFNILR